MQPLRIVKQKKDKTNEATQERIIKIDVTHDWLDIHCPPNGQRLRLPNTQAGQRRLVDLAGPMEAQVYFEATDGQEWWLNGM